MTDVKTIINKLDLSPHPEGGYYRERYRSKQNVQVLGDERSAGTSIYFLLAEGQLSNWHRVRWDELWHFYDGDPLILEVVTNEGELQKYTLDNSYAVDVPFQGLVPQNCWQRAYSTGHFSLVGCTVSPGFEFDDFEMVEPEKLAQMYPQIADKIMSNPLED